MSPRLFQHPSRLTSSQLVATKADEQPKGPRGTRGEHPALLCQA